ncbi:triose-phosphate isomerase [archaeon CG06_land_8_20_14_3_00_37_11]|nr:MAG: triose-phosphate isomerase [archaeon CG06_land_8_20_14_3_00_37_11]
MVKGEIMKPIIIVNFKAYREGLGSQGLELAQLLSKYENVIMSVPAPLIGIIAGLSMHNMACDRKAGVFAQHVDAVTDGAHTGSITAAEVKEAGATGSLVNHSERRIPFNDIKKIISVLRTEKLTSILCCQNLKEAVKFKKLKPDYLAYEPEELIGGDVSVSDTKPGIIKDIVEAVKPVKILVGAGIKTRKDIQKSIKLGAYGVLIASGVIKAEDKKKIIKELIE